MKICFVLLLSLFFGELTYAGSNVANLTCKSASGRTLFTAELQDIYSFNEATFTVDDKTISFGTDLCSSIIFDRLRKVFTLSLNETDGDAWLTFYAIPSSFEEIKDGKHDEHYRFKAIIKGKDPRPGNINTPEIELECELTYSI